MRLYNYLKDWFYERKYRRQRAKNKYSIDMCFSIDYTLLEILPKMLEEMRKMKHGYPQMEDHFPEVDLFSLDFKVDCLRKLEEEFKEADFDKPDLDDDFTRWQIILMRMIYCLQQADENQTEIENKYYEEFHRQSWPDTSNTKKFKDFWNTITEPVKFDKKGKPKLYKFKQNEVDPELKENYFKEVEKINKYKDDMKTEAFNLINKYFWCLWD